MIRKFVGEYGFDMIKKKVTVDAEIQVDKRMSNNSGDTKQLGMKRQRVNYG